eukprot:TRINITY_DN2699_c0_g1_i3.p1 TRINITY_DN2699_c0_g1~~TRINITY_DN2699_c0_g1_i3.p1  ORF type:complete len:619 (-),score=111.33 TRINITY_DN2699_c0_g1_i3:18-1874(-)
MERLFGWFDNLLVCDRKNNQIRRISSDFSNVSVFSGSNEGYRDGSKEQAQFNSPSGICVGSDGSIYICDRVNQRIRKIDTDGIVSTIAGTGSRGFVDGQGLEASFNSPNGMCIDAYDRLYICDFNNHAIRMYDHGMVSTVAGCGEMGNEDGPALSAKFNNPTDVCIDYSGILYICDSKNQSIKMLDDRGIVVTIKSVANGLNRPSRIFLDQDSSTMYIGDQFDNTIQAFDILEQFSLSKATYMEQMLKNQLFTDCKVRCSKMEIPVHKSVIKVRCPELLETTVESSETLESILYYIYTDRIKESDFGSDMRSLLKLYQVADSLNMKHFCHLIELLLKTKITKKTVLEYLYISTKELEIDVNFDYCIDVFHSEKVKKPKESKLAAMYQLAKNQKACVGASIIVNSSFESDINEVMARTKENTDITLRVTDVDGYVEDIECHKVYLSIASEMFSALFRFHPDQEVYEHETPLSMSAFKLLVDFWYCEDIRKRDCLDYMYVLGWGDMYISTYHKFLCNICTMGIKKMSKDDLHSLASLFRSEISISQCLDLIQNSLLVDVLPEAVTSIITWRVEVQAMITGHPTIHGLMEDVEAIKQDISSVKKDVKSIKNDIKTILKLLQ